MDQGTLVTEQIEDGKRLIERLNKEGVEVTAACWLKEAEDGPWFLYLASSLVDNDGATKKGYRCVNALIRQLQQEGPFWIEPLTIKLVEMASPISKAVQVLHRLYRGPVPTRLGSTLFGGMSIEGGYVYPPLLAPVKQAATTTP